MLNSLKTGCVHVAYGCGEESINGWGKEGGGGGHSFLMALMTVLAMLYFFM
jgi:hypothetical protein